MLCCYIRLNCWTNLISTSQRLILCDLDLRDGELTTILLSFQRFKLDHQAKPSVSTSHRPNAAYVFCVYQYALRLLFIKIHNTQKMFNMFSVIFSFVFLQVLTFGWREDIRVGEPNHTRKVCFDAVSHNSPVTLYDCHGMKGNQLWRYRKVQSPIYAVILFCIQNQPLIQIVVQYV